ncbi:MAG: XdhC family protein [Gammaproteobacteria bacterium]|nr:XdhC family protein [Gammaproteobacteria bacterium]
MAERARGADQVYLTLEVLTALVRQLYDEISKRNHAGESVAMATIVDSRGSTPQKVGAKMLVFEDGLGVGTVGGGCVEADIWREAAYALADGDGRLISVDLIDDLKGEGDVCGGTVNVFIDVWKPGGASAD